MQTREARELGARVAALVQAGQPETAYTLLAPTLAERTPFRLLRHIGEAVGAGSLDPADSEPSRRVACPEQGRRVDAFLECIAEDKTIGGWVVIASALEGRLDHNLAGALARCRKYIIAADVWYAADTLGEGVAGQALVSHFQPALDGLAPWRQDANPWVRRAVGTAAHFWAKRSRGWADHVPKAKALLAFLEPMFDEWNITAVKGVGWGLKTLGRYYPDLMADWLAHQVLPDQRRYRALMLRKALTYLSDVQRAHATGKNAGGS